MGDFSKISGSYYRQTEDMMEPGKEREKDPNDLFSTATAIKSMNEQGGQDKQGLSTKGADSAAAAEQDPAREPASKHDAMQQQAAAAEAHEQEVMQRNARNNT